MDSYLISITPAPLSQPGNNSVLSSPWNVTLNFNLMYRATIRAVNCAGESGAVTISSINFGKLVSIVALNVEIKYTPND